MATNKSVFNSPLGPISASYTDQELHQLSFSNDAIKPPSTPLGHQIHTELSAYFQGKLQLFTIPLAIQGSPFQIKVWNQLIKIPYGTTCSYKDLARYCGHPNAAQAVGQANSRNPISLLIPCHRVIRADGQICGYAGGVEKKQSLLNLEKQFLGLRKN